MSIFEETKYRAGTIYRITQHGTTIVLWLCDWDEKAKPARSMRAARVGITRAMNKRQAAAA